ncbi:group II intron maturase-specific domain-containing protein [Streptomyces sp. ITFR-16]|uniref:group II intron maturase-specific domain-containing protein n=1 Tax=Streptomyces sp. ITFR-16 TaxID=3075198 RepID=UPI00288ABAE5|nr:group II intron maturase-specific domain-containing protein [Streptomyces sp. ITFR-16]WNI20450.1 group II intron maturase-specific domain-containing protein [Streptomyces sp. ITFR-16]
MTASPRAGLAFNEDKTRVVHLSEGFDFLGFNIQRMRNGKVIIRPSRDAVKRLIRTLKERIRSMDGWETIALIGKLNPIIRGWATYYRGVVSSNIFAALDSYVFQRLWLWAMRRHRNKGRLWRIAHYWGEYTSTGEIDGCSAILRPVHISSNSVGPELCGTSWSRGGPPRTTRA